MRPVIVAGTGKSPFGAFADRDLRSLAVEAGKKCLANAHMRPEQVESFYLGNFAGPSFVGQNHLAPFVPTARGTEILAGAGDTTGEVRAGSTFPSLFAMIARRHMHEFGTQREHLAAVAVKNHANGALNPDAHLRKPITIEQALAGKPVADPLNLYDCSLISDGAASVIVAPADRARDFSDKPVRVLGVAQ